MEIPAELELALAAFVAVLAANALKWLMRLLGDYVRGTPNKIDDKIWEAVHGAVSNALRDEKDADMSGWEDELAERDVALSFREQAVEGKETAQNRPDPN